MAMRIGSSDRYAFDVRRTIVVFVNLLCRKGMIVHVADSHPNSSVAV